MPNTLSKNERIDGGVHKNRVRKSRVTPIIYDGETFAEVVKEKRMELLKEVNLEISSLLVLLNKKNMRLHSLNEEMFLGNSLKDEINIKLCSFNPRGIDENSADYIQFVELIEKEWVDKEEKIHRFATVQDGIEPVNIMTLLVSTKFSIAPVVVQDLEPTKDIIKPLSASSFPFCSSSDIFLDNIFCDSQCCDDGEGLEKSELLIRVQQRMESILNTLKKKHKDYSFIYSEIFEIERLSHRLMVISRELLNVTDGGHNDYGYIINEKCSSFLNKHSSPPQTIRKTNRFPVFHRCAVVGGKAIDITKILKTRGGNAVDESLFCQDKMCCDSRAFEDLSELNFSRDEIINNDSILYSRKILTDWKECPNEGCCPKSEHLSQKENEFKTDEIRERLGWVSKLKIFGTYRWVVDIPLEIKAEGTDH